MIAIEVYPSTLPGEPIERYTVARDDQTLGEWLRTRCPSYQPGPEQPWVASLKGSGLIIATEEWETRRLPGATLELRPQPQDLVTGLIIGALLLGAVAAAVFLKPKIPATSTGGGAQGNQLQAADVQANTPRLNGIIPEIAGRYRVFPDYLSQPRKYFNADHRSQSVDVLLCVGQGEYAVDEAEIFIEKTPLTSLNEISTYAIHAPGASLAVTPYCQIWHNAREVGASTGASGLRLTAGQPGTAAATASKYRIESNTISIPPGSGVLPQDWEIGNVVSIVLRVLELTVVDGGGPSWLLQLPDYVRGQFADLNLAEDDIIAMGPINDGIYKVKTVTTPVSDPGTPSTITGSVAASLSYATIPVSFELNGFVITLDEDFSTVEYLIDAIEAQVSGVVITESGGALIITEDSPYSGVNLSLSGYYAPVLGAAPVLAAGTKTQEYDELTLDVRQEYTDETTGEQQWDWFTASNLRTGTFSQQYLHKPRISETPDYPPFDQIIERYSDPEYRITGFITGDIPGGTGNIGLELQRLNPDGSDDTGWTGFGIDVLTDGENVDLKLVPGNVVGGWLGPFRATPANEASNQFEYDVFSPAGIAFITDEGNVAWNQIWFEVQWRSEGGDWSDSIYHVVGGATRDQLGWTIPLTLAEAYSQVDLRMRRISTENTSLSYLERLEWYGLRCRLADVTSYPGVTTMTLTLQGSDKISSTSENKLNLIVTRKLNGTTTRSIAEWARYVCGTVGYAASDLNETELSALEAVWDDRGDWYDHAVVSATTVKSELARVFQAGFAEFTIDHGQIRPVRDQVRTTYEQLYTPQNMLEPLKRQFQAYDPDEYNGVDVEYIDGVTWEKETVECRLSGDAGTRVEKIRLDGVTDRTRAWRIGMRERRMQKYRRKTYQFKTELDALNSKYLSYCLLADDVPGYDQSALLVDYSAAGGVATLTISEPRSGNLIALRRPDGSLAGPYAATAVSDHVFTIPTPDFSPIIPGTSQEPTHVLIGHSTNYHYDVLITEISPQGNSVSVQAVNYDARVYADDDNSPA